MVAYDVGVAGIHRLLRPIEEMKAEQVQTIIVVAGMEGALTSVVNGQSARACAGHRCTHFCGVRRWRRGLGRAHVNASVLLTGAGRGEYR